MKIDVIMPKMGESLQEGTIIKWLKKEGEKVERDEMILEISTDKVDTEVPAPQSGILSKILFGENETIEVGKKIAEIDTEAIEGATAPMQETPAPIEAAKAKAETVVADAAPADNNAQLADVVMPKMGESLQEGTIIKWLKQVGEKVDRDEMILEISTDKVDTEVPSPVAGVVAELLFEEGTTVEVGQVIAKIASGDALQKVSAPVAASPAANTAQPAQMQSPAVNTTNVIGSTFDIPARKGDKFYSPLVREISKKNKISLEELESLSGSGSEGRVTKEDLLAYIAGRGTSAAKPQLAITAPAVQSVTTVAKSAPAVKPAATPVIAGADDEIIPMDRVRQLISDHMVYSKQTSAHVTSVGEADITHIVRFRNKYKNEFLKREGIKLTFTPFFAAAAVEALKQFPMVNVSVDGKNIIRHRRINLGMATALDDGNLIVPVIKNADSLSLTGIARSINDLASRARSKKLNPDDIQGGTFTVTNVGTFGTLFGTPIINQPQTGIMGIGAIQKRAVVREFDGEPTIVIRDMVYVSLTYDHRVVDGMLAGQWLAAMIRTLENMNEDTLAL